MKNTRSKWLPRAIAVSIIFHLLLFLLGAFLIHIDFGPLVISDALTQAAVKSPPPLVFELVETPESARAQQPTEQPQFVSDKIARAQNEKSPNNLPVDDPFSEGIVPVLQMPEKRQAQPEQVPETAPKTSEQAENVLQAPPKKNAFSREFLSPSNIKEPQERPGDGEVDRPRNENLNSRAPDLGSFSLNTYSWEYAPYMLRLKRKIEKNIFPPPAFTHMGMISGISYIKFRIAPNGKLEVLEVVDYNGHKSLMETSKRAIELSLPFEPLPKDFPEQFLEITARFEYYVKR
ncbi:MAG: hypothetical protein H6695_11875 [Deferribacteres bacterium]|nr:hypothetical protein [candidate division KSB1 bacterium]MCB9510878.1 hypothetical protein [Deferribacteres bacterium]